MYEDFYEEFDNYLSVDNSMNMIFFGPASSFLRLDAETILHILVHTKKQYIPIEKILLAWDTITGTILQYNLSILVIKTLFLCMGGG